MKIEQLTFTRFIAAVSVVFFHHTKGLHFFASAQIFVSYFFILSGFVLIISQKQRFRVAEEYTMFYINRFARTYPLYLISNFLFAIVVNILGWGIVLNILGVQSFLPNSVHSYNVPGWTLSVEFFFYLVFPFLVRYYYFRFSIKFIMATSIMFWLLCQSIYSLIYYSSFNDNLTIMRIVMFNPINHLNEFILGSAAGLIFQKNFLKWQGKYDWAVLLLASIIFIYASFLKPHLSLFDHNGLLALLFIPFIMLLSLNTGYISNLLKMKPFVFAGNISFTIYILAEPVLEGLNKLYRFLWNPFQPPFYFSLALLISISAIFFLLIEKPLQHLIKKKSKVYLDKKSRSQAESSMQNQSIEF